MADLRPLSRARMMRVSAVEKQTNPVAEERIDPSVDQLNSAPTEPTQFIQLNDRWRVRLDDPAQWLLQRQEGRNADGSPRYRDRSFCTQRRTLLRDIRDHCGEVDPAALRLVEALPQRFPYKQSNRRW